MKGEDLKLMLSQLPERIGELHVYTGQDGKYTPVHNLRVIWLDIDGRESDSPIHNSPVIALECK